jgi:hypothetical protein
MSASKVEIVAEMIRQMSGEELQQLGHLLGEDYGGPGIGTREPVTPQGPLHDLGAEAEPDLL